MIYDILAATVETTHTAEFEVLCNCFLSYFEDLSLLGGEERHSGREPSPVLLVKILHDFMESLAESLSA